MSPSSWQCARCKEWFDLSISECLVCRDKADGIRVEPTLPERKGAEAELAESRAMHESAAGSLLLACENLAAAETERDRLDQQLLAVAEALGCTFSSRPMSLEAAEIVAERDALRADALRYRWLRDHDMTLEYCEYINGNLNGRGVDPLDSTIDAASPDAPGGR